MKASTVSKVWTVVGAADTALAVSNPLFAIPAAAAFIAAYFFHKAGKLESAREKVGNDLEIRMVVRKQ